ncbi:MAG TPA: transporter substrate-binding domain-containing protein [Alphaproteobacteria bacterium]|jgi:membrane-bound lytic murein transglycosylase MltF|nr:transporter substrate-binding domain-containing protein [Alphaproteobacteria bacterium]
MNTAGLQSSVHRGVVALLLAASTACSGQQKAAPPATEVATPSAADAAIPQTASPYDALPESVRTVMDQPFTGDFDAMVKRRVIRVAVTFNRTHYFIDKGQERGLTYESLKLFEHDLNADLKTGNLKVHVVIVPMTRKQLYPALASGKVDMVAAMVTVRPELEKLAAFSVPTRTNVNEVVVTGPGAPPIATADDLAGQEVFVRKGSIYEESLDRLNVQLKAHGKPAVEIDEAPDVLEDDDVLEMVNAGLVPITVVDDYLAEFWSKVFTSIKVRSDIVVRSGGSLAVAFRKENPKLRETVDRWLRKHPKGDAFRNTIERRYLDSVKYAKNAAADTERQKLQAVAELFKKYGAEYNLDPLLMAAQGYQESTLDQDVKSPVGAIGVMQVMPPTGKELNVGDITKVDANIHAGVKYMRFMMDQYFRDDAMDTLNKELMTFAAYNAGPGRLKQLRRETEQRGLDPNVWFGNVERVASERIGRETVTYVSNIYKYYIAYGLMSEQRHRREAAKAAVGKRN